MSLTATAARGGGYVITGQIIKLGLLLVNLVVLGRLLSPTDFGLLAMVTAVVGVGELFRDFGLSSAAVQAKSITQVQKSNLFWINTLLGAVLTGVVCVASPLIATLYDDPRLVSVALAVSVTFLFNGVQTQFQVELIRRHKFFVLASTDVAAQTIGLGVAIAMAVGGFAYWALVGMQVSIAFALCLMRIAYASWRPGLPSRGAAMGSFLRYGWHLGWAQAIGYVSNNIDSVVIGARWGGAALGLYSRAFQIITLPMAQLLGPLTNVALPLLSRIESPSSFARAISRIQVVLGYSGMIFFSVLIAAAGPFIELLLGDSWSGSAPILQALAIGAAFQVLTYSGYWVFLARGLTRSLLHYNLVTKSFVILCVVVGNAWGPMGAALGYSVGLAVSWPVSLLWLSRVTVLPARALVAVSFRSLLLGLTMVTAGLYVSAVAPVTEPIWKFLMIGVAAVAAGMLVTLALRSVRSDLTQFASLASQAIKPRIS